MGRFKVSDKQLSNGFIPNHPIGLSKEGIRLWNTIAEKLQSELMEIDIYALKGLVDNLLLVKQCSKLLSTEGLVIKSHSGFMQPNPLISIKNKAETFVLKYLKEFNMTPYSRKRQRGTTPKGNDELDTFLEG